VDLYGQKRGGECNLLRPVLFSVGETVAKLRGVHIREARTSRHHGAHIYLRNIEPMLFVGCDYGAAHGGEINGVAVGTHTFSISRHVFLVCNKACELMVERGLPIGGCEKNVNETEFGDKTAVVERGCRPGSRASIPW